MTEKIRKEEKAGADEAAVAQKGRGPVSRKKRRGRKIFAVALVIVLIAAAAAIVAPRVMNAGQDETGLPVNVGALVNRDVEDVVTISGAVEGADSAKVMSASNYEIVSILVAEGDLVKKGQVLARLNTSSLNEQYHKAAAALEASRFQYEATSKLYEEGAVSEQSYIQAEAAYNNDRITLGSFEIGEKSVVKSPISGTVTRVNASVGSNAGNMAAGEALFVIEDLSRLRMNVRVSEYDISKVQLGQSVSISSDALKGKTAYGVVNRIAPTGEQKNNSSNERIIPVEIGVTESNGLIAGVTGKAKILIHRSENALAAPIDAIWVDPSTGESSVFQLRDDGTLKSVPITLGVEDTLFVEILSDTLHAGDQVVLSPTFEMRDGMKARASTPAPAA